ncbi:MAG: metallophosphoesterase [bacterium]|nr:metallophosphoesterase [bacterium]
MKVGIISDTHDNYPNFIKAMEIFKKEQIALLIHCGDWVSASTFMFFDSLTKDFPVPVKSVFGNNEGAIKRIVESNLRLERSIEFPETLVLETKIADQTLAVFHGQDRAITQALIQSGSYDLVFTGHTHKPLIEKVGNTLHLNPGTICFDRESRFNNEYTIGIYESDTQEARIVNL